MSIFRKRSTAPRPGSGSRAGNEVVLATFNLCAPPGGYRPRELRPWAARAGELPAHLEAVDVLLAQEAGGVPDDARYADVFPPYVTDSANSYGGLPGVYSAFEHTRRHLESAGFQPGDAGSDGRWIFWKASSWSPTGTMGEPLPGGYWLLDHGAQRPRAVAYQALRHLATGTLVVVVDPHLEFLPGADGERVRLAQTRDLLGRTEELVEGLGGRGSGVVPIIAGDFGAGLAADVTRPRRSALQEAGYRDARDIARVVVGDELSTSKAWNPLVGSWSPRASRNHVDQIWVPHGVEALEWRHHHQNVFKPISDHDMITARVVIAGGAAG